MTPTEAIVALQNQVTALQQTVINLQGYVLTQGDMILTLNKLVERKAIDIIMPKLEAAMKAGAEKAKEN